MGRPGACGWPHAAADHEGRDPRLSFTADPLWHYAPDEEILGHRVALDAAVFAAYAWPTDLHDDEVLARLLALDLERAFKLLDGTASA
jgi:hypothetical protein